MRALRVTVAVVSAGVLVACSGGEPPVAAPSSTTAVTTTTTTVAPTTAADDPALVAAVLDASLLTTATVPGATGAPQTSTQQRALVDCEYASTPIEGLFRDARFAQWQGAGGLGVTHYVSAYSQLAAPAVDDYRTRSTACASYTEEGGRVWARQGDVQLDAVAGVEAMHAECWEDTSGNGGGRCFALLSRAEFLSKVTVSAPRITTARDTMLGAAAAAATALAVAPIPG